MIVKTKYKVCRRLGNGVFDKCQTQKFSLSESRRGKVKPFGRRRKMLSGYATQLLEKQKLRFTYGLKERQLAKHVKDVASRKGIDVGSTLFENIESRLDNVVYRLSLAPTRSMARQMVSHGHITVGGRKVNVPSFKVKIGDVIGIRSQSLEKALFTDLEAKMKSRSMIPAWLSFDLKKKEGVAQSLPKMDGAESFDLTAVIEFYSR
ncbi:30S ribosomal protein S4 [Patescibacteria group bacterium]